MKKLLLALIMAGALAFGQGVVSPRMLKQDGATSGQCLQWDGSKWAPAACTTSAGSGTEYQYNNSGSLAAGLQWHCPNDIVGFGGCTASFPGLKRSGTRLEVRLADDSGLAELRAKNIFAGAANLLGFASSTALYAPSDGSLRLTNAAGTDFGLLQFGGTTSGFPALKRSSTALQVRLADDSADALLKASVFNASTGFQVNSAATSGNFLRGNGTYFVSSAIQASDLQDLNYTWTGAHDFGGATLEVPNSTSLPGTCTVGEVYVDSDASAGQRLYLCESADTWVLQTQSVYNVKAFGAVGDGVTDDTTAIANAITAAGEGQTVYFPPGTYITDTMVIGQATNVRGAGPAATIIKPKAGTTGELLDVHGSAAIKYNLIIEGFALDLTGFDTLDGIAIDNNYNSIFHDIRIDGGASAINVGGDSGVHYTVLQHIDIVDPHEYGLEIDADHTGEMKYTDIDIRVTDAEITLTAYVYLHKVLASGAGGQYFDHIWCNRSAGTVNNGFYATSSEQDTILSIVMSQSMFDNVNGSGYPLRLNNVKQFSGDQLWLYDGSAGGTAVVYVSGGGLHRISDSFLSSSAGAGLYLRNVAGMQVYGNRINVETHHFDLDDANPCSNLVIGGNLLLGNADLGSESSELGLRAGDAYYSGMRILAGGATSASTLQLIHPSTGTTRYIRVVGSDIQILSSAFGAAQKLYDDGRIGGASCTFANLAADATDGDRIYCSDCTKATPCASGGSGALAVRINGAWDCNP